MFEFVGLRWGGDKVKHMGLLVIFLSWIPGLLAQGPLPCEAAPGGESDGLNWMAGHWRLATDGKVSEEWWVPSAGGLMLGMHRDTRPGKGAFFEYLRIEFRGDAIVYVASPFGRGTTEFKLTECGENWVKFENPQHDWPTVIRYVLEGETLVAVAEGGEGDQARSATWRLTRVASRP